jgi:hypothetical protein
VSALDSGIVREYLDAFLNELAAAGMDTSYAPRYSEIAQKWARKITEAAEEE